MYEYEYRPLVWILFGEIFVFLCFLLIVISKRTLGRFHEKQVKKTQERISSFIIQCLEHSDPLKFASTSKNIQYSSELLVVLEEFDKRLKNDHWCSLKEFLAQKCLLPKARRFAESFFWKKRSFAARCFALVPLYKDEKILISLFEDSYFLIQSKAALSLIFLESPIGVQKIVEYMSCHTGFSYWFLCDALRRGSRGGMLLLAKLATQKNLHMTCLQVLSGHFLGFPLVFLEQDLKSQDLAVKLLAINILSYNPTKNTQQLLIECSKDSLEEVRKESVIGLSNFPSEESVKCLMGIFSSQDSKIIRLAAARSLKKIGEVEFLEKQSIQSTEAAQIAAYMLQFG